MRSEAWQHIKCGLRKQMDLHLYTYIYKYIIVLFVNILDIYLYLFIQYIYIHVYIYIYVCVKECQDNKTAYRFRRMISVDVQPQVTGKSCETAQSASRLWDLGAGNVATKDIMEWHSEKG